MASPMPAPSPLPGGGASYGYQNNQPKIDFQWKDNGTGGVNYFANGQPITREQFASGTGQNVGSIEGWVHQNYLNSQGTQDANGGGQVLSAATTAPGGGSGSAYSNPAAAALYDQEAQSYEQQLANLDPVLAQTLSDIKSGYNKAVTNQGQSFANATQDYNTAKSNNVTDQQSALDNIATNTRNNSNAIQRLLGMAGSGNSSASEVAAPYLVNQGAATANRQAQTTFGRNEQALDTSFARSKQANQTALDNLSQQEYAAENQAKGSNASSRAGILQQIITALGNKGQASGMGQGAVTGMLQPYVDQLNAANKAASGFTGQYQAPIFQTAPVTFTPGSLDSYNVGVTKAPTQVQAPNPNAGQNVAVAPNQKQQQPSPLLLATL